MADLEDFLKSRRFLGLASGKSLRERGGAVSIQWVPSRM